MRYCTCTTFIRLGLARIRVIVSSWVFHLFLSGIIMLLVFLHPPALFRGDFDTALNYLNTIVSSLSTILALCISIILVAIQLTASNYTHRVLDYFVRLPYNASLFSFYLVTILRSFFLMSYIKNDPNNLDPGQTPLPPMLFGLSPISRSLDNAMSADLVMVAICFISLLVYMYAVIQLLKPERIITLILRDYDRAIVRSRWRAALDNVEQICDIAKRAASFSDSVTGAQCVEVMSQVAAQLPLPSSEDDPLIKIHQSVVDQWVEIVAVAIKERETGLLRSVIDALFKQAAIYMKGEAWPAAETVVMAYRHLVFAHLLNDAQVFYVNRIAAKLYQLAGLAAAHGEPGQTFCLRTWEMLRYMGECAFSSQPGGIVPLMEGLLMNEEVPNTLALLPSQNRGKALTIYLEIWKAFVLTASIREVARWARWWAKIGQSPTDVAAGSQLHDCPSAECSRVRLSGQSLALRLASHCKRDELAKTMRYVWKWDERRDESTVWTQDGSKLFETEFLQEDLDLFDGWPVFNSRADTFSPDGGPGEEVRGTVH